MICAIKTFKNNIFVTDAPSIRLIFSVVKAHVNELSSARIWQHKLCATLLANVNINYCFSHQSILPYLYYYTYQNRNNLWKPYCVVSFNMGWQDISKFYPSLPLGVKYEHPPTHVKIHNTGWRS